MAARGRPKGLPKTGGRKKGSVDKLKREAEIAASGLTPLDYILGIVRAETPPGLDASVAIARETLRFEAAKAFALYPAISSEKKVSFRQVSRRTGNRLRHQLVDSVSGEIVESHDRVGDMKSATTAL